MFRGAFAVGHRQIGVTGRMLAASLACDRAVVSHRSAAFLSGLTESPPLTVDVIASGDRGRRIDGIRPHSVPPPGDAEAIAVEGVPCTSPSRTLVDLASILGESSLRRAVEQAAVLGTLDIPRIDAALALNRRRGAPILRKLVADHRGGIAERPLLRSRLEARALALVERHGLPRPLCNRVITVGRRRMEIDLLWPEAKVAVELDGRRFHEHPAARGRDKARDRELVLAGFRVLRFGWADLDRDAQGFVESIRRLLVR